MRQPHLAPGLTIVILLACSGPTDPVRDGGARDAIVDVFDSSVDDAGLTDSGPDASPTCDLDAVLAPLEAAMTSALDVAMSDTDYTLLLERGDGRQFTHSTGPSTAETTYQSASTSKWVTATVILWVVDQGLLSLDDTPQTYIDFWSTDPSDLRAQIRLRHLLSFTSGLIVEPFCINMRLSSWAACIPRIHDRNAATTAAGGVAPGTEFSYGSAHMQVAGLMAVEAYGASDWAELFDAFRADTGLFPNAVYDLPSIDNPRLAGGMRWRGDEYLAFVRRFRSPTESILSSPLMAEVMQDQNAGLVVSQSPALDALGQDWHYSFGFWLECDAPMYDCTGLSRISSPGAYGAYPFIDLRRDYFGILARQGVLGSYRQGYLFIRSIDEHTQAWAEASCP